MKKNLIIGAFAVATVLVFPSSTEETSADGRPMFGKEVTEVTNCVPSTNTQADGSPLYIVSYVETTYIFWIGFPKEKQVETSTCNLIGL